MPRKRTEAKPKQDRVSEGAVAAEELQGSFPTIDLPIQPPFPPMEAKSVEVIPSDGPWQYEPKWDGFRCIAFYDGHEVVLQSKSGQPLGRYFPELNETLHALGLPRFVLDGEIVIEREGHLSFDDLLMRIHPAESRIRRLSKETPATLLAFDLLVDPHGETVVGSALTDRRKALEKLFAKLGNNPRVRLSPATRDFSQAERWMRELAASGFDGVVAKRLDEPYESGERAMVKIKRIRTADCVVGGFRYASKGGVVGSLLLGLYDDDGLLHHVGFTSGFATAQRAELLSILKPYVGGEGFTGRAPGGPSRWSTERSGEWEHLAPKLVCEVSFDHFSGGRFRHGTKFLRWRPEKKPKSCTMDQVRPHSGEGTIENLMAA